MTNYKSDRTLVKYLKETPAIFTEIMGTEKHPSFNMLSFMVDLDTAIFIYSTELKGAFAHHSEAEQIANLLALKAMSTKVHKLVSRRLKESEAMTTAQQPETVAETPVFEDMYKGEPVEPVFTVEVPAPVNHALNPYISAVEATDTVMSGTVSELMLVFENAYFSFIDSDHSHSGFRRDYPELTEVLMTTLEEFIECVYSLLKDSDPSFKKFKKNFSAYGEHFGNA